MRTPKPFYLLLSLLLAASLFAAPLFAQEIARVGYSERGKAGYYTDNRGGTNTRSGEKYDMNEMEAAHKYIAFNSLVKVVNLANNKEIVVRINDRPYTDEHIIELTKAAADKLGLVGSEAEVRIEIIALGVPRSAKDVVASAVRQQAYYEDDKPKTRHYYDNEDVPEQPAEAAPHSEAPAPEAKKAEAEKKIEGKEKIKDKDKAREKEKSSNTNKLAAKVAKAEKVQTAAPAAAKTAPKKEAFGQEGTYTLKGIAVAPKGFGLQAGVFGSLNNALDEVKQLEAAKAGKVYVQVGEENGKKNYRVLIGAYANKAAADKAAQVLKTKKQMNTMVKKHL